MHLASARVISVGGLGEGNLVRADLLQVVVRKRVVRCCWIRVWRCEKVEGETVPQKEAHSNSNLERRCEVAPFCPLLFLTLFAPCQQPTT